MKSFQTKTFLSFVVVTAMFSSACVHDAALQKRVDEQDRRLQAFQRRQDHLENKLGEMELRVSALAKKVARTKRTQPPPLNVVRLAPPQAVTEQKAELDEYAPGAADDGAAPVVIKLRGRRYPQAKNDQRSTKSNQAKVKTIYADARRQYTQGHYAAAAALFLQLMQQYPRHDLADNSAYWYGMCAYEQGRYTEAIEALQKVAVKYPSSAKIPDAFLAIARAYAALGDKVSARVFYLQLVQKYPQAEARPQAEKALKQLDGSS